MPRAVLPKRAVDYLRRAILKWRHSSTSIFSTTRRQATARLRVRGRKRRENGPELKRAYTLSRYISLCSYLLLRNRVGETSRTPSTTPERERYLRFNATLLHRVQVWPCLECSHGDRGAARKHLGRGIVISVDRRKSGAKSRRSISARMSRAYLRAYTSDESLRPIELLFALPRIEEVFSR